MQRPSTDWPVAGNSPIGADCVPVYVASIATYTGTLISYYQTMTSDKSDDPLNNTVANCVGELITSAAGEVVSGSGICLLKDVSEAGLTIS